MRSVHTHTCDGRNVSPYSYMYNGEPNVEIFLLSKLS